MTISIQQIGIQVKSKIPKENQVIPCQSPPYLIWNDPLNHFFFVHECGFASIFGRYPLKLKGLHANSFCADADVNSECLCFAIIFLPGSDSEQTWTNTQLYITGSWTITDQQRRLTARKTFPCKEFLYMCIQKSKLAKTYRLRFRSNTLFQPLHLYWTKVTHLPKSATWGILVKPLDYVSFDTKWFVYTLRQIEPVMLDLFCVGQAVLLNIWSLDWGVWTGTVSGSSIISVVIFVVLILLRPIIILIWLPVQHHDSQLQVVVVDGVVAPDLLLKVQEELLLLVRPWESAWLNPWTLNTFWYEAATSFLPYLWGRETRSSAAQS